MTYDIWKSSEITNKTQKIYIFRSGQDMYIFRFLIFKAAICNFFGKNNIFGY